MSWQVAGVFSLVALAIAFTAQATILASEAGPVVVPETDVAVQNDPAIPDEFEVHLKPEDWNWYHRQLAYGRGEENWYEHACARCDPNFAPPKPIAFVKPSDLPEGHDCLVDGCDTVTETDMNGDKWTAVTAHNVPTAKMIDLGMTAVTTRGMSGNWSTWDA